MGFSSRFGLSGCGWRPSVATLRGRHCLSTVFAVAMIALTPRLALAQDQQPTVSVSASPLNDNRVLLTGQVSCDGNPGGLTVYLSGVVDCTVVTNADGSFAVGTSADCLGEVDAEVTDRSGLTGGGWTVLSNPRPSIDFGVVGEGDGNFTLRGRVIDTWSPGLEVIFSGLPGVNGHCITVDEDGTFALSLTLDPGEYGVVTASVMNWWGQTGQAQDYVDTSN
jgi:hypothetical protein